MGRASAAAPKKHTSSLPHLAYAVPHWREQLVVMNHQVAAPVGRTQQVGERKVHCDATPWLWATEGSDSLPYKNPYSHCAAVTKLRGKKKSALFPGKLILILRLSTIAASSRYC